jgi:hypothetical protein
MREGNDIDIFSPGEQFFCFLAFDALLQGKQDWFCNKDTSQVIVYFPTIIEMLNDFVCFIVYLGCLI